MVNKEERLIKLIRREQAGKGGNYEEICELLFDEMNNLVRPVCESAEESKKKVKKLFVRMLQQINEIDTNDDIHLWIAGFSTVTLYEILTKENGQIITYNSGNIDYPYSHIDEDEEFKSKIGDYNDALANPQRYMFAKDFFKKLTKGQIILFEMFCYEGFTVDEIQELLEIDKVFITSELSALKDIVLGNVNGNQEIELVSQEDNSLQEEEDSEDIAAIKAAVAAIVSDTEDEVKTETDGYKDIVSAVNAIRSEIDENGVDYSKESDNLGATLVNINKKRINNSLNNNIVSENIPSDNDNKGEFEVDYDKALSSLDSDKGSIDKSDLSIKDNESDNVNSLEKSSEKSDNDTVYSDTSNKGQDIKVSKIEADYIDDDEDEEVNEEEKEDSKKKKGVIGLFGLDDLADDDEYDDDEIEDISDEKSSTKVNSNKSTNKNDNKNNKLLKILSIAIPSVAVVIFIVILLTSGAFKKSSSANNSGTIAETKNSTKKQETTTQEQTTQKETATEKKTQQTTTAKKTESTTQATTQEETTEKQTTATKANSSTVATTQAQTKTTATQTQATTEATTEKATQATTQVTTQATTEATTQATQATTEATISTKATQATTAENTTSEETLKATQVTTSSATTATQADTDTIVDEKNGTALH
jgi:hypothetical protein